MSTNGAPVMKTDANRAKRTQLVGKIFSDARPSKESVDFRKARAKICTPSGSEDAYVLAEPVTESRDSASTAIRSN